MGGFCCFCCKMAPREAPGSSLQNMVRPAAGMLLGLAAICGAGWWCGGSLRSVQKWIHEPDTNDGGYSPTASNVSGANESDNSGTKNDDTRDGDDSSPVHETSKKSFWDRHKIWIIVVIIVTLVACGCLAYFFMFRESADPESPRDSGDIENRGMAEPELAVPGVAEP